MKRAWLTSLNTCTGVPSGGHHLEGFQVTKGRRGTRREGGEQEGKEGNKKGRRKGRERGREKEGRGKIGGYFTVLSQKVPMGACAQKLKIRVDTYVVKG